MVERPVQMGQHALEVRRPLTREHPVPEHRALQGVEVVNLRCAVLMGGLLSLLLLNVQNR
jgi:hypothetical protein